MIEHAAQQPTIRPAPGAPPAPISDVDPRCWRCGQKVAYVVTRPWRLRCPRCRSVNAGGSG